MLVVISPAKRLDWSPVDHPTTEPEFAREANTLAGHARALSLSKLKDLMGLSDDLARLNRDRFKVFSAEPEDEALRPAAFAFAGDTYLGLDAHSLDADALSYAKGHLRILSGLYGVLRPLDAIQPYRLEMGSRLKTRRGSNLYEYWRDAPAKALNAAAKEVGAQVLVNCASQEYFGAVSRTALSLELIEPAFYEVSDGQQKMISFFAKKARGAMARFMLEHRVADKEGLKAFDSGGYSFDPAQSTGDRFVYTRQAEA